ncbi:DUF3429 domain-containing protein [Marinomonas ostreistagni]|uniref:DUF3429 domain-containing protein n=1 Tax=Marinomonas ostreistagni TaxID=359209 RepID=UPI00194F292F|nr:DUF3429 domain-containing protein [Marinomonas ostreistagni]MBM6551431.1 DUF3429 domain-containing protein [Marinomonas ostreistagni]
MRISSRPIIMTLGYLGLVPFIASTVIHLTGWMRTELEPQTVFITYSAIILSFLCGALWGQVIEQPMQPRGRTLLVCSNIVALVAWLGLLIQQPHMSLLALFCGYVSVFWLEVRWLKQLRADNSYYPSMRFALTTIVCSMHLLMLYPTM